MLKDPKIVRKLARIREVPTLPAVMRNVMAVLSSDDSSADDLARILTTDQALCSKMLKTANTAFFAQNRRIYDIGDAVVLLGFDYIAQLTLATTVFSSFGPLHSSDSFSVSAFWEHSIAAAFAGKLVAERAKGGSKHKALYTAGLLHDLGKLLLITRFPTKYAVVLDKAEAGDAYIHEIERKVLGFTHCEVAEWICERWNFPERLVRLIADHHSADMPSIARSAPETAMMSLANVICNRLRIGSGGNRKEYPLSPQDYEPMGFDAADIRAIEDGLEDKREEIETLLKAFA
jgi:putative nucleotidyltransferase with HDIG domain